MMKKQNNRYNAEIVAGSLLIAESRQVIKMMVENISEKEWMDNLYADNILQKRNPETVRRQVRLIKKRLSVMNKDFYPLIHKGNSILVTQCLFVAAIKHSLLLGDFLQQIILEKHRTLQKQLAITDWNKFFLNCSNIDPSIESWADSTKKKVKQVIFRILAEAGYLNSTREKGIIPVIIQPALLKYLKQHKETYIIKSISFK